jgi:hypothetical protein
MAAMPEVVIAERYCGPPTTANGGYACGLVAQFIDGSAEVTLRSPPPLDRPLDVREDDGAVALWDGETLVAQGKPSGATFDAPPGPVGLDDARAAIEHYEWMHDHPYPTCFVCGPERADGDGLRIFPSPVDGGGIYAAPWTPGADLAGDDGVVRPEFAWASLDCPSGLVTNTFDDVGRILLGRLAAELHRPVRAGEDHVLIAWPIGRDGRKLQTGSALYTADGELLASARAVWIDVGKG